VHCEWLQSLSTNKCTYYINIIFTLHVSAGHHPQGAHNRIA
jgi:hypothetical protein